MNLVELILEQCRDNDGDTDQQSRFLTMYRESVTPDQRKSIDITIQILTGYPLWVYVRYLKEHPHRNTQEKK